MVTSGCETGEGDAGVAGLRVVETTSWDRLPTEKGVVADIAKDRSLARPVLEAEAKGSDSEGVGWSPSDWFRTGETWQRL